MKDEKPQTIFKIIKRENPFVMLDKQIVENPGISWAAKGLLAYLLSRPNDWRVYIGDLLKRSPDGLTSLRSITRELKRAGYLKQKMINVTGRIEWIFEVYETPQSAGFQSIDKPSIENQSIENASHTNNDNTKIDLTNLPEQVGKGDNPEPGPAISDLKPSTPGGVRLLAVLKAEATARAGRPVRGYTKFPTLAIRDKFLIAESKLGSGLDTIITRALEAGCTSVPRAVNYLARVAENGNGRKPAGSGGNGKGPARVYPKTSAEALAEFQRRNPNLKIPEAQA